MRINLEATLFCGQSFAWTQDGDTYRSVIKGKLVSFTQDSFACRIEHDSSLYHYFDMGWPYEEAEAVLSRKDEYLEACIQRFGSIHILNQDPWEVLVSFILSQNNTIKRIRTMYQTLSKFYGKQIAENVFAFPRPEELAAADEKTLRELGMGFRAPYLIDAIANQDLLFQLQGMEYARASQLLQSIKGVGPKVAACILLFGFHTMEAFPMDTWMRKVMEIRYSQYDASYFDPYPALAQQYLFHCERTRGGRA